MKKYILGLSSILTILILSSFSISTTHIKKKGVMPVIKTVDGKTLFVSKGCTICHTNKENSIGPKTKIIADAYKGKRDLLIKFFKKESKPIVDPSTFSIMAANLFITKKMSDKELSELADYILKTD